MKTFVSFMLIVLVTLSLALATNAEEMTKEYRVWLGAHSTSFSDYQKKVGEFDRLESKTWVAGEFELLSYGFDRRVSITGDYINDTDYSFGVDWTVGTRSKGKVNVRTYERQLGQDQLSNLWAREWLGTSFGGKVVSNDLADAGADYTIERKEVNSEFDVLLSQKNNVRLMTSHRSIWKDGHDQLLSNSHCATCHVVSQTGGVNREQHQFTVGVQADLGKATIGYELGYRKYESQGIDPTAHYDKAQHPVNGGSAAEFTTRVNFDDVDLPARTSPKTEKLSHRLRWKGDVGNGRLAGSIRFFRAKNLDLGLEYDGWSGAFNYAMKLNPKTRLVAKVSGSKFENDSVAIDVPDWRAGRPGYQGDFDYIRQSSLNRTTGMISAELFHRLNLKTNGSLLFGYESITRNDYPYAGADQASNQIFTQLRLRHRASNQLDASLKYRLELTSDPLISARGLLEARGNGVLHPIDPDTTFIYYFQREELRYQNITTLPTQEHQVDLKVGYRPSAKLSANFGFKFSMDKNDDLDSLDVKHSSMRPSVSLTAMPSEKLMVTAGFTMNHMKSRGPVAVALFDG